MAAVFLPEARLVLSYWQVDYIHTLLLSAVIDSWYVNWYSAESTTALAIAMD